MAAMDTSARRTLPFAYAAASDTEPGDALGEEPRLYRFTVTDYHRMAEAGILKDDDRVELIEGQIVMMPPIDPLHSESTDTTLENGFGRLRGAFRIRCQHPLSLGRDSEPIPDISVVKLQSYGSRHPGPKETFIVVEVANTSLAEDLGRKRLMYAAAGIPEYWVLDVIGRQLHQFSQPVEGDYREGKVLNAEEVVTSVVLPQVVARVAELLPALE